MPKDLYPMCSRCTKKVCHPPTLVKVDEKLSLDNAPNFCPMKLLPDVMEESLAEYDKPEVHEFARQASIQEAECYEHLPDGLRTRYPRIEELVLFAHKCRYKRLGLAFCAGLHDEAVVLTDILENNGFEVVSVRCKVSGTPKERIGIKGEEKIRGADWFEAMCSPITQAEVLNRAKVDMAVMLGLCLGHDTLFIKYCRVPMTVIAVKDRVFGHNPLAALYVSNSYYRRLRKKQSESKPGSSSPCGV